MEKITVFTPTYNRAYILPKLYNSLKIQTCKDFIWLIIDDGSNDDTQDLVNTWKEENLIKIEYQKQKNSGKSMAHNRAVEMTKTELFTCVDSDDYLVETAIEDILQEWNSNINNDNIVGILAYRGFPNGKSITSIKNKKAKTATLKDAYNKYGLKGDTMLVYRTKVISKFEFPYFIGERFVPEAFLYDQIDQEGKLLILPRVLYICEYLEDGYTKNMSKLLASNPQGYLAYIMQRLRLDMKLKDIILDTIRYTSMCILIDEKKAIVNSTYPFITILTYPISYLYYIIRYRSYKDLTSEK